MKKTIINELIDDLTELKGRGIELTHDGMIIMLENAMPGEEVQIIDAFDEGVKYGNDILQTFDNPASRYYRYTYNKKQ